MMMMMEFRGRSRWCFLGHDGGATEGSGMTRECCPGGSLRAWDDELLLAKGVLVEGTEVRNQFWRIPSFIHPGGKAERERGESDE